MFGFLLAGVAAFVIGATISSSGSGGGGSYSRRNSTIDRELERMREQNENLEKTIKEQEKAQEDFIREIKKRDERQRYERESMEKVIEKNISEAEELKALYRKARKSEDEQERIKAEEYKKRIKELNNENKEKEKEISETEQQLELDKNQIKKFEKIFKTGKNMLLDLINANDFETLDKEIKNFENEITSLQEILIRKNINSIEFHQYIDFILLIYKNLGDLFFEKKIYERTTEMYEKLTKLDYQKKYKQVDFNFRYGKSLYEIGKFQDAIEKLNRIDITKFDSKLGKNDIKYEYYSILFDIALTQEDDKKIEKYSKIIIENYSTDKSKLNSILKLLKDYIQYNPTEENITLYMSLVYKYKSTKNLAKELEDEIYNDYKYKEFYTGLKLSKELKLDKAKEKLRGYNNNDFIKIILWEILNEKDESENINVEELNVLRNKLESLLEAKKNKERINFYNENNKLIYLDTSNVDDYFKLYLKVKIIEIDIAFKNNEYKEIFDKFSNLEKYFENYPINDKIKRKIVYYYHFFKKQNEGEITTKLHNLLKKYSTELELEIYEKEDYSFNKKVDELYELTYQKINFINSPFYRGYIAKNNIDHKNYTLIETYRENLNKDKKQRKEVAINKEITLGEKSNFISKVYNYSIDDGVTQVIYPSYKSNLKEYIKNNDETNSENKDMKISIALEIISIFEELEKNNIILSYLNPELIMINEENHLELRSIFLDNSFKSESTTSVGSQKVYLENKYGVPDEMKDRNEKSNYYLAGLLIYELFWGEYLFYGVEDSATITKLHKEKKVFKNEVYSLKDRWVHSEKDLLTRVEKINIEKKKEDGNNERFPISFLKEMKKILNINIDERPNSLEKIKKEIRNIKKIELNIDTSKYLIKKDLIIFLKKLEKIEISIKNKIVFESIFGENIEIDKKDYSYNGYADMKIKSSNKIFELKKIGRRYKISQKKDIIREKKDEKIEKRIKKEKTNVFDLPEKVKVSIEKINNYLLEEDDENKIAYLYQTRQILYEIEDKIFDGNIEKEYIQQISKITDKKHSIKLLGKVESKKFLEITSEVLKDLKY